MNFLLKISIMAISCIGSAQIISAQDENSLSAASYIVNRAPLLNTPYIELPLGTIKAEGWLLDQLQRMKKGMTGNLDQLYPEVMGPRNGWLGGDGDVWERGPYWIDGLLPLAYILNDKELIEKTKPWIEWSLASQQKDGYFGPSEDKPYEIGLQRDNARDWWPKMVVLKIMQQYYSATQDQRVIELLTKYFRYQLNELDKKPLNHWTHWGKSRGGDNLMVVLWLYNITGDLFLLELADLLYQQTFDWKGQFAAGDMLRRNHSVHTVNLGQGFKTPAIYYQRSKDPEAIASQHKAVENIRMFSGWPTGLWAGDELLRVGEPTQGSELCTAVEMMLSLEKTLVITGDPFWADYLERIAYNALPTQVTDDFDARQYYQQINQIKITRQDRNFITCYNGTDQLMGLLSGYPCCTSNLHQGWPKFTQNLWYATPDGGVAALIYAPSKVNLKVADNVDIQITEKTTYPFSDKIDFHVNVLSKRRKQVVFPFHLRIPQWCKNPQVSINGKLQQIHIEREGIIVLNREWKSNDIVTLVLPMQVIVSRWYEGSAAVERGPLVYALKMEENWVKKPDDYKFGNRYGKWYYEVTSPSAWNFCLLSDDIKPENIEKSFTVNEKELKKNAYPWNLENNPLEITAYAKRMVLWSEYNDSAGPLPYSPQYQGDFSEKESITLIPYGCTTLRIGLFPVTQK